ncbi:hypothetical protein A4S02_10395 [Acetobacter ascendens]|uniref:Uncharacterized protein n=1 Tax=Acetobacter ascendens TaxID=481146 RepID=A0A1D8QXP7_9PROT|nr:hypothetical protein [Acetobacter ascendens]AOW47102.1 hypothetical protein A4S02_10395 [Acetobacter ascendens]
MTNLHPFPVVFVEWEDSAHYEAGWKWSDEVPAPTGQPCVTCGFLIKESERAYMVALSAGDVHSDRQQFNGIMEFPKSCVQNITFLAYPSPRPAGLQQICQTVRDRLLGHRFSNPLRRVIGLFS